MLVGAGINLIGQVIGLFGKKGEAQQAQLKARVEAMDRSYTDEYLVVFWTLPGVVAWFNPDRAQVWIDTLFSSELYAGLIIGITASVFGLGKIKRAKK